MKQAYWIGLGALAFIAVITLFSSSYIVPPGHRGIKVTLGSVSASFLHEGFGLKMPFMTSIIPVSIQQRTGSTTAECFSSDLQHVNIQLNILYRVPEQSVVRIYQEYSGDPFHSLIIPRINEAIKENTALQSAEQIVKRREEIKTQSLALARKKIGELIVVEDLVINDITLSKELAHAIEQKMVQEQEAAKARYIQQKTEIEAKTAVIRAKGEAESIEIRGRALRASPDLIRLHIVEKWDGKAPLVVTGGNNGNASNFILPLDKK